MLVDILDYWILKLPSDSFLFSKKLSDDISAMGFQFWAEIKYLSNSSFIIYLFIYLVNNLHISDFHCTAPNYSDPHVLPSILCSKQCAAS